MLPGACRPPGTKKPTHSAPASTRAERIESVHAHGLFSKLFYVACKPAGQITTSLDSDYPVRMPLSSRNRAENLNTRCPEGKVES
jgi:hypothetical protein